MRAGVVAILVFLVVVAGAVGARDREPQQAETSSKSKHV